jgi:hypothetical protein
MYPSCEMVEYARTFLMSSCTNASSGSDDDGDATINTMKLTPPWPIENPLKKHGVEAGAEVHAGDGPWWRRG